MIVKAEMMKMLLAYASLPSVRNGLVVMLFLMSMVMHLHIRVATHFADSYGHNHRCNTLIDLPQVAQREMLNGPANLKPAPSLPSPTKNAGGLHAPNSTALPLPNENGIILFYMHIPKTGGTTMMAPFVKHPEWRYRMVFGPGKQMRYRQEMYDWLENWEPGTKVYYEYHAGKAAPYMDSQVRQDLLVWKAMAKVRNIPFFAFTVVREPLSMAVSHFNFYYASGSEKDNRYFWVPNPTEADFMELSVPNPQCLFCHKSEIAYYEDWRKKGKSIHSTPRECDNVYDAFVNDFDWIGTTEKLSTETLPMLEQLGNVRYCPEVRNKSHDKISKQTLSAEALEFVHNITALDRSIYERTQRDFPPDMWTNFDPPVRPPPNPKKICRYRTGQALPPGELPKRPGELKRFLAANPGFVEAPKLGNEVKFMPHYLK